jgi:hypothetical protein
MPDLHCTDDARLGILNLATLKMLTTLSLLELPAGVDVVVITAGTNGVHSGPADPHYRGDALDLRTHTFPTRDSKFAYAARLNQILGDNFYAFVEDPDSPNEHIHVQVAKGHVYPPLPGWAGSKVTT